MNDIFQAILKQPNFKSSFARPRKYLFALSFGAVAILVIIFSKDLFISKPAFDSEQLSYSLEDSSYLAATDISSESRMGISASAPIYKKESDNMPGMIYVPQSSPIKDAREFLKYDYHSTIKTREVGELSARVRTIIKGYGGRVDSFSVHEKSGYIVFVVPKSSFETFKDELKTLAPSRFFKEDFSMQNLLPQKVAIEQSVEATNESLVALQKELADLTSRHNAEISSLQRQLNSALSSIKNLQSEVTTDTARLKEIVAAISQLNNRQWSLQKQISDKNYGYNSQKKYTEARIKDAQSRLTHLAKQDQALVDNVETIQGSITVQWVGAFDVIKIYSPHYWLWIIVFFALIFMFNSYNKRRVVELP